MKRSFQVSGICLLILTLFTSCTNLTYVHNDPLFSFEYPGGFYRAVPLGKDQVVRLVWKTREVPFFAAYVTDKPKGMTLENLPERLVEELKETPIAISLLDRKKVTLSDGTDAMAATYKWKIKETPMPDLFSASVMTIKEDKIISVSGTSSNLGGYQADRFMSLEELMTYCMTLKLNS